MNDYKMEDALQFEAQPLAVITGASSGIGLELARIFAQNGYALVIAAEDPGIHKVADELHGHGTKVEAVRADLATESGVNALYEVIRAAARPVDVIAMNAGVGVGGQFTETSLEDEMNLINLNISSIVRLTKYVLPDLVARGRGKILYTSSIAAEAPGPYYAVYAASKAFLQSFAEAIRAEVKDSGVTVTSLQPGATDTNFFARADMLNTKAGEGKKDDPADVAKDGYDALMAGKDHVVAGSFKNKIQATVSKFATETLGAKMQGSSTKPNDLH